jgi:D-inositol-3-phosphate glycosyltransferase
VPSHDPRHWAGALRRVLADPALHAELSAGALEHARDFSWERTTDETLEVYQRAVRLLREEIPA